MVDGRHRVLPDQHFGRNFRAEVADARTHVAVGQLEPGAGEGIGERGRVLVEAARNRPVDRVHAHRHVGGGHHDWHLLRRIVRVGCHVLVLQVLGLPLPGAGGALGQLPLIAEQHIEIAVVPLDRVRLPRAFDAARDCVASLAGAESAEPAEALGLDWCAFWRGSNVRFRAGAVGLAEGVATGGQGDCLFVVHRHAGERLADIAAGGDGVRPAVGALRIDVDEAHLDGRERGFEQAVAGVAAVGLVAGRQPLGLGAPVDVLFRLEDVGAAAAEAERLEAHRLHRDVAGENVEVGPRQRVAVLLLDRPQQAAGLVEVAVVGPAVQGREPLRAVAGAAAAVSGAIGAGGVPGHAHEQRAVVAVVGRPPGLAVAHQGGQVTLHGRQVERLECGGVIEALAHRVRGRRVLVQDLEVELIGPPLFVGPGLERRVEARPVHHWATVTVGHVVISWFEPDRSYNCISISRIR